jgi:hypothetical protein
MKLASPDLNRFEIYKRLTLPTYVGRKEILLRNEGNLFPFDE